MILLIFPLLYTNLSACKFSWQLVKFPLAKEKKIGHAVIASGKTSIALAAGKTGTVQITLPANWMNADALSFTARDQYGRELYTWTWLIQQPATIAKTNLAANKRPVTVTEESIEEKTVSILCDGIRYRFDTTTGYLTTVTKNQQLIPFGEGPVIANGKQTLQKFSHTKQSNNTYIVEAEYTGDASLNVKWTFTSGSPAKLEYSYTQSAAADFHGITFNLDETKLKGMKWLGAGPYRVWKNRLKGAPLNVWQKKYNKAITGEVISYPEFSGYHGNVYWVSVETTASSFTIYTDKEDLFVQMLKPQKASTTFIPHVNPPFPESNFGFLNAIAPIGTKFRAANTMGPQSQKNDPVPGRVSGRLWFEF